MIARGRRASLTSGMDVRFFASAAAFHQWLTRNHDTKREVWVGFHRKDSGKRGLTYPEAVDEALCFGWIDGIRKKLDDVSYTNRFTPRKPKSNWSLVNTRRVAELEQLGRMTPAGRAAFAAREIAKTGVYSFEQQTHATLSRAQEKVFRANRAAWNFFAAQPPGYRRRATWWVISARQETTRERRLAELIAKSAGGFRVLGV